MKKIITSIFFLMLICTIVSAKKVKLAVDMEGHVIISTGMHVFGDFQAAAGYAGGDWNPGSTPLTRETIDTNIYSVVVDIPAFLKYEYKFINGDQSYEVEFVPDQSRVGYNFDDNRWVYVDSLDADTLYAGPVRFSQNAPDGLYLVRFYVDMQNALPVDPSGIHVAGTFQGWDPATVRMYSFVPDVYEIISYVTAGTYEYKFYNGNTSGASEIVPLTCASNNNRQVVVSADTVLSIVCFSGCASCAPAAVAENLNRQKIKIFPNPAVDVSFIEVNDDITVTDVSVSDLSGKLIRHFNNNEKGTFPIETSGFEAGMYFVSLRNNNEIISTLKLIIE